MFGYVGRGRRRNERLRLTGGGGGVLTDAADEGQVLEGRLSEDGWGLRFSAVEFVVVDTILDGGVSLDCGFLRAH